jgi:hypothetical protein
MTAAASSRLAYLRALWHQGLWGRWLGILYGAAGLLIFIRDDFWRPADETRWALINLIPGFTLSQWANGALIIVLVWLFEASHQIHSQASASLVAMQPKRSPAEERKFRATRATLPMTLNGTCSYILSSIGWLKSLREKARLADAGDYHHPVAVASVPRPDNALIAALGESVEHLDPEIGDYIRNILSRLQTHYARLSNLEDQFQAIGSSQRITRAGLATEVERYIAESVELFALVRQLFPYARAQNDGPIPPIDLMVLGATFRECELRETSDVEAWNILTTPYLRKPGDPPPDFAP